MKRLYCSLRRCLTTVVLLQVTINLWSQPRDFFPDLKDTIELRCLCEDSAVIEDKILISIESDTTNIRGLSYYAFMFTAPNAMRTVAEGYLRLEGNNLMFLDGSYNFSLFCGTNAKLGTTFPRIYGNLCEELVFLKFGADSSSRYIDYSPHYVFHCGLFDSHIIVPMGFEDTSDDRIFHYRSYSTDIYEPIKPEFYYDIRSFKVSRSRGFVEIVYTDYKGRTFHCK